MIYGIFQVRELGALIGPKIRLISLPPQVFYSITQASAPFLTATEAATSSLSI